MVKVVGVGAARVVFYYYARPSGGGLSAVVVRVSSGLARMPRGRRHGGHAVRGPRWARAVAGWWLAAARERHAA